MESNEEKDSRPLAQLPWGISRVTRSGSRRSRYNTGRERVAWREGDRSCRSDCTVGRWRVRGTNILPFPSETRQLLRREGSLLGGLGIRRRAEAEIEAGAGVEAGVEIEIEAEVGIEIEVGMWVEGGRKLKVALTELK